MEKSILYFRHMLDAITKIETYTNGIDYNNFMQNSLVQDGVIRQIEIIGEASKRIGQTIKDDNTQVPWKDICGMRDKLIHDYFGVDPDALWDTVEKDIPSLKEELKKILIGLT